MGRRLILAAALCAGCFGMHRGSLYPEAGNQVFVGYFRNDTFYRDFQFLLTEQLKSEIVSRPGLRLTSREEAEILIEGRVTAVRQRVLSEDPQQRATDSEATVTVRVNLVDARSGETLKTRSLTSRGEFAPAEGEDLEAARTEAFRFLARDIVRLLEQDF